jgi:hypothetical protein
MMTSTDKPIRCPICGYYLTTAAQFTGYRCVDPGHWQAAGLLEARDYYPMAQIASRASVELNYRSATQNTLNSSCC